MSQETIKGWGGKRENQTGRPVSIPAGEGDKKKVTASIGTDLLAKLRERWPDLSDQDLVRAACWEAIGEPKT